MSKWAEQTGSNKKRWIPFLLPAALLLFFEGMFLAYGPGVYNDSEQYLQMHIHREPLYPLFLWVFRLCTPEHYLVLMGILQNLFMAVSIWLLTGSIARKFSLSIGWQFCIFEKIFSFDFGYLYVNTLLNLFPCISFHFSQKKLTRL